MERGSTNTTAAAHAPFLLPACWRPALWRPVGLVREPRARLPGRGRRVWRPVGLLRPPRARLPGIHHRMIHHRRRGYTTDACRGYTTDARARSLPVILQHLDDLLAQGQLLLCGRVRACVACALAPLASLSLAAREGPPELADVERLDLAISTMRYVPTTTHTPRGPISDRARALLRPIRACVRPMGALASPKRA